MGLLSGIGKQLDARVDLLQVMLPHVMAAQAEHPAVFQQ